MELSPGKIFLADDRGLLEDHIHRRFSTFNFDNYYSEHKQPFASLHTFNDEVLPAAGSLQQKTTVNGFLLLIPITGGIDYEQLLAEAGQVILVPIEVGTSFEINNPYPLDWVNFLCIEIKADLPENLFAEVFSFDLENTANQLLPAINAGHLPFSLHLGRFGGREEAVHQLSNPDHKIFAFVIGGAFELQNRLLHERDGLALWQTKTIEAEALSNNAVLLLLELD